MTTEYKEYEVPAEGSRVGMIVNEPVILDPAIKYPIIFFLHGIGERGDGSDTGLDKLRINGSMAGLEAAARYHEFILVEPQADNNWEHGELEEAYAWAKSNYGDKVNWNKCYLTGLSLGGGGNQRFISVHTDADQLFAACAPMCPGPNQFFILEENYKNIANTKIPLWFFHCLDDSTVKPEQSTKLTISKIKAINPDVKVVATFFNTGGHTGGWKTYSRYQAGVKAATPAEAVGFNDPACNLFEWFLMNEIGKPAVLPPSISAQIPTPQSSPVVTEPIPAPPIVPVKKRIRGFNFYGDNVKLQVLYEDGTQERIIAPVGDACFNCWVPDVSNTLQTTLSFRKNGTKRIGPDQK